MVDINKSSLYKALISDIDGTLTPIIPNSLPSEKVTCKIKEAVNKGLIFSLATGRPFFLAKYLVDHLGLIGPSIVDNGAVIVDSHDGSTIWEANLPNEEANQVISSVKKYKLRRASLDSGVLENPTKLPNNSKVRKLSIHDISEDIADKIISKVSSLYSDVIGTKAASYKGQHLVDVYFSNIKATKQYAVFKLSKILGIQESEIIGVGDGYNDFPLLMACGMKVAMGNSVNDLKGIADYIALSVEEDGLAEVIDKFYLNKL